MNAPAHITAGIITTTGTYVIASRALGTPLTIEGLLIAALLGIPTGIALDLIEPASHPNHRGFAHSITALAGIIAYANNCWNSPARDPNKTTWVLTILAGITSHHLLDATTTKSLPLLGIR